MSNPTPITKFFPSTVPANVERPAHTLPSASTVTVAPRITPAPQTRFNEREQAEYDNIVSALHFDEESDEEENGGDIEIEVLDEGTLPPPAAAPMPLTAVRLRFPFF